MMETRDYYLVAALIHQRIKVLDPIVNPADVEPFNQYRELAAKLAVVFEDDRNSAVPRFDGRKFIELVMAGPTS